MFVLLSDVHVRVPVVVCEGGLAPLIEFFPVTLDNRNVSPDKRD